MKAKITSFLIAFIISANFGFAQDEETTQKCAEKLSIFDTYRKQKKYTEAYEPWMFVRENCPKYSRAIYAYGDKILEDKIEKSSGAEQVAFIKDLMLLNEQYSQYFASKHPKAKSLVENADIAYKYREQLGISDADIYKMYDDAFKSDVKQFKSAKGLYTYFSLKVDAYDNGPKTPADAQQVFDKYDDVIEHIENIVSDYTVKLNKLVEKEEAGAQLTKKEARLKKYYESNINAYDGQIVPSMDKKLGDRANCEVLVPLYKKDFEANKSNSVWLQRAMNRMYAKGCKEDPLFLKLVEQKNNIEPNADTAFYLYLLTGEQQYFDQTIQLENDPLKKAKLYKKLAIDLKKKGSYGKARKYFNKSLSLNPSDGSPYLSIATMYAKSANNCGDTTFNKRAVFWLAANTADRAGRVDPRLKKAAAQTAANFRAKAPDKSMIFSEGKSGQTIRIGCWIGSSVTVPKI